jgi:hypothetical protein
MDELKLMLVLSTFLSSEKVSAPSAQVFLADEFFEALRRQGHRFSAFFTPSQIALVRFVVSSHCSESSLVQEALSVVPEICFLFSFPIGDIRFSLYGCNHQK